MLSYQSGLVTGLSRKLSLLFVLVSIFVSLVLSNLFNDKLSVSLNKNPSKFYFSNSEIISQIARAESSQCKEFCHPYAIYVNILMNCGRDCRIYANKNIRNNFLFEKRLLNGIVGVEKVLPLNQQRSSIVKLVEAGLSCNNTPIVTAGYGISFSSVNVEYLQSGTTIVTVHPQDPSKLCLINSTQINL